MCKHVLNAQFMMWTGKQWYDCVLCHAEANGGKSYVPTGTIVSMKCKKCLQVFRKDFSCISSHEHCCPHCKNLLFLEVEFPSDVSSATPARGSCTLVSLLWWRVLLLLVVVSLVVLVLFCSLSCQRKVTFDPCLGSHVSSDNSSHYHTFRLFTRWMHQVHLEQRRSL